MMDANFRQLTPADYLRLKDITTQCFEGHLVDDEVKLIVEEGWGKGWVAEINGTVVGCSLWLYKPFTSEIENRLQPRIIEALTNKEAIFHDHVEFDESTTIYYHLIVIDSLHQNQGIGKALTSYCLSQLPQNKKVKTCVRINNIASIKILMKFLGVCLIELKPRRTDIFDSLDINANAIQVAGIKPTFNPNTISTRIIYQNLNEFPDTDSFLLPVNDGTQDDLETETGKILVDKITKIFELGFLINGVFKGSDLGLEGDHYFLCVRK